MTTTYRDIPMKAKFNPKRRCKALTRAGKPCQGAASTDGYCGTHGPNYRPPRSGDKKTGYERQKLINQVCEMRAEGHQTSVIAKTLGVGQFFVQVHAWGTQMETEQAPVPSKAQVESRAAEIRERIRREQERQREEWNREADAELARCRETGDVPFWHPASERLSVSLTEQEQRELDALVETQKADDLWATSRYKRRGGEWASLDEELPIRKPGSEGQAITRYDFLTDDDADPYRVLTGTSADHIREAIGQVTQEQVARMDGAYLALLRERLREAGITGPAVQRKERERLKEPVPHRGRAPSVKAEAKSPRHRGRVEAQSLHKTSGKRFKREQARAEKGSFWRGLRDPRRGAAPSREYLELLGYNVGALPEAV